MGPKKVKAESTLTFSVSATDPDNDPLTYSASAVPSGASFDSGTGTFTWTPLESQVGAYSVVFSASDGSLSDSETVPITVEDITAPTDTPTPTPTPTDTPAPTPTITPTPIPTLPSQQTDGGIYSGGGDGGGGGDGSFAPIENLVNQPAEKSSSSEGVIGEEPIQSKNKINPVQISSSEAVSSSPDLAPQPSFVTSSSPETRPVSPKTNDVLPPFGINSVIVFGGTVTMTSAVKRFGEPRDYEIMLKTLIKGIGIFTAVIACWLIATFIQLI
jgi:hypothetical protein